MSNYTSILQKRYYHLLKAQRSLKQVTDALFQQGVLTRTEREEALRASGGGGGEGGGEEEEGREILCRVLANKDASKLVEIIKILENVSGGSQSSSVASGGGSSGEQRSRGGDEMKGLRGCDDAGVAMVPAGGGGGGGGSSGGLGEVNIVVGEERTTPPSNHTFTEGKTIIMQ